MPDILSEFRKRYPQYGDLPDQQIFNNLADPAKFRQAFPEYADLDDHTIGKNVVAESGKPRTTEEKVPWYKAAWEELRNVPAGAAGAMNAFPPLAGINEMIHPGQAAEKAKAEEAYRQQGMERRKAEGRPLWYRTLAPIAEGLGVNVQGMENATSEGEILGRAAVPAALAMTPMAIEGVGAARRGVAELAMEKPVVARQKAMNVAPKSNKALRVEQEGTRAAPYLKGSKNLADLQGRIPAAKQEVFQPYMDAVDRAGAGGRTVTAPDGTPVSPRQLEQLRQETSAQLQATRKMPLTDQLTQIQKNQKITELTRQYRAITDVLDPEIKAQGIDPKRTRATFGAIKGVERRVEGRSTLLEGKPSGLGKAMQIDLTKPFKDLGNVAEGARDIAAGRGWFKQKPTDVQVREGFRKAAPKPDLTIKPQPPSRGLPPGPLVTPPPAAGPPSGTPPPVAPTSRAQRLGLLLPEQSESSARPQIPVGYTEPAAPGAVHYGEAPPAAVPAVPTETGTAVPANIRIVRDPKTGRMKRQYLTSAGGEIIREEPIMVQEAMAAKPAELTKSGSKVIEGEVLETGEDLRRFGEKIKNAKTNEELRQLQREWHQKFPNESSETFLKNSEAGVKDSNLPQFTLSTDSLGVKWAEGPNGVRVSIPNRIPDGEIMGYAEAKLAEQTRMQSKIKTEVPKAETTDLVIKGLTDIRNAAAKEGTDATTLAGMDKFIENERRKRDVGPPAGTAERRAGASQPRNALSLQERLSERLKKPFVKDPQAGVLKIGGKGLRVTEKTLNDEVWFNTQNVIHVTPVKNLSSIEKQGLKSSEGGLRGSGVYFGNSFGSMLADSWKTDAQMMDGSHAVLRITPSKVKSYNLKDTDHGLVSSKTVKPEDLEYSNDGIKWQPLKKSTAPIKGISDIKKRSK